MLTLKIKFNFTLSASCLPSSMRAYIDLLVSDCELKQIKVVYGSEPTAAGAYPLPGICVRSAATIVRK